MYALAALSSKRPIKGTYDSLTTALLTQECFTNWLESKKYLNQCVSGISPDTMINILGAFLFEVKKKTCKRSSSYQANPFITA
jgi:hypothetical protein